MYDNPFGGYRAGSLARAGTRVDDSAAQEIGARLAVLRQEHRDLDAAIEALRGSPAADQLQLARLKKRKLRLKDEISVLEDLAVPDIIA